jgi:outer membrane protein assembly factor BamD
MQNIFVGFTLAYLSLLTGCAHTYSRFRPSQESPQVCEQKAGSDIEMARRWAHSGHLWRALETYRNIHRLYPNTSFAPVALHEMAQIYVRRRQYNSGFGALREITQNYHRYPRFDAVIGEQFDIACHLMRGYRPYYLGIIPGFRDRDSSVEFFESVVDRAPFDKRAPKALMYIAKISRNGGAKTKAIEALDRLIEHYPGDPSIPEAYRLKAETCLSFVRGPQYDQAFTQRAIRCYEDFLAIFDSHTDGPSIPEEEIQRVKEGLQKAKSLRAESRLVAGDFFYHRRHYGKGALIFYEEATALAPGTPVANMARFRMEDIQNGIGAPLNLLDRLLGPYKHLSPEPESR